MLRSEFDTSYCCLLNFHSSLSLIGLMKKWVRELTYLFQLEDSTEKMINRYQGNNRLTVNNTCDIFKAIFWIIIAVSIPLFLGH